MVIHPMIRILITGLSVKKCEIWAKLLKTYFQDDSATQKVLQKVLTVSKFVFLTQYLVKRVSVIVNIFQKTTASTITSI
ncbi:hypothetical protein C5F50_08465 [Nitrosopumilus ureiphilus]|uniref:Uncharacterized protein n=2 Tax=Nitrosopumilus ureiphilus TaxID=1470067 RepID=A0A7D5R3L5_9ARCH|nr:hypothetical protein C5F50_08465 [Nitrosopumilus ureiphilus]